MYLQHASLVEINKSSLTENLEARLYNDANCLLEKFPHQENKPAFFGIPFAIKDLIHVNDEALLYWAKEIERSLLST